MAVVTDSTAYLPADAVERHGLTVVPLQVVVGGRSLAEGVEVTSDEVATALRGAGAGHLRLRTDRDWIADVVRFVANRRLALR